MTSLRFEWDEARNRSNRRKHGVSFEEARTAFLDENARAVPITRTTKIDSCF